MTSSVKPELHNISQRRQRRTEPRQQAVTGSMHKKLMRFGSAVFELCEWTERQADVFVIILAILPGRYKYVRYEIRLYLPAEERIALESSSAGRRPMSLFVGLP